MLNNDTFFTIFKIQKKFYSILFLIIFNLLANNAFAIPGKKKGGTSAFKGGSTSIGIGFGTSSASQTGLNTMIQTAKTEVGSTASEFSSGLEVMAHMTFRFSNNFVAFQIRPSYFSQSSSGNSTTEGSQSYNLTGYTLFPILRLIPLSNDIIDFYLQAGIGYGHLNGEINNGSSKISFNGGRFGLQAGLGADFCFVPNHCIGVEGNYRYLPIERNIVSSASGALPHGASQATAERELEDLNGSDISTSLSGISGLLTYSFNF